MENKESTVITFRVNPEELQAIEAKAAEAGQNRAEYTRSRVLAPDNGQQIAALEKQLNALTDRLAAMVEEQATRRCNNPNHAETFGAGHCFLCDLPIASKH
jgi:flagellar biosynthesis/type III secretory pathway protein FliH